MINTSNADPAVLLAIGLAKAVVDFNRLDNEAMVGARARLTHANNATRARDHANDLMNTLEDQLTQVRATSMEGVLFQLCLLGSHIAVWDSTGEHGVSDGFIRETKRLIESAVSGIEVQCGLKREDFGYYFSRQPVIYESMLEAA